MAGPLNTIFTQVSALAATQIPGLQSHFGAVYLTAGDVPPRAVWIPQNEPYSAPQNQGGSGVIPFTPGIANPPVATRNSAFEIHLWAAGDPAAPANGAADLDACETLINAYAWAIYDQCHGAFEWVGISRWSRANIDGQILTLGIGYILSVLFKVPVTRPVATTAPMNEIPATVTLGSSSVVVDIK